MPTNTQIIKGFEFLGITDRETMQYIFNARDENKIWRQEVEKWNQEVEKWKNRYEIPKAQTKKFYTQLLQETQVHIDHYKSLTQEDNECVMWPLYQEDWIEKKRKLKNILKFSVKKDAGFDINRAKAYPIEQLIEFGSDGFAKCLWHNEKTGSLKWYKKSNNAYCFSCSAKKDSIDVYQIINNVSMSEAVKALCQNQ